MYKVLIAESSEDLRLILQEELCKKYTVISCGDGQSAMELLRTFSPDILILDLMLPIVDGLSVLEHIAPDVPPVILCTDKLNSDYTHQAALELGVGYFITKPCNPRILFQRLDDMIRKWENPRQDLDNPYKNTVLLLQKLGIPRHLDGYKQLRAGIPLFAQDPSQRLHKELYPAIAQLCGFDNAQSIEHSMRTAIETGWKLGDRAVWNAYFPDCTEPPTNKKFIARLAEEISRED